MLRIKNIKLKDQQELAKVGAYQNWKSLVERRLYLRTDKIYSAVGNSIFPFIKLSLYCPSRSRSETSLIDRGDGINRKEKERNYLRRVTW